eukprot:TRINITY_DN59220_c0_g1_i1.p1 TRINITY_DN59220_c0_g1~~TRINITY_DN59220_c0_g1_i1.p1  ORF type:complete len:447 (-),score=45.06 TRINITY_DN59220_c0_g1_i1:763-2103(-)
MQPYRVPTSYGAPPGSMRGPAGSVMMNPGTLRSQGLSASAGSNITVAPRSMTGMQQPIRTGESNRQNTNDPSYWSNQLRAKSQQLQQEGMRLQQATADCQKQSGEIPTLKAREKQASASVAKLKDDISKCNFALEKIGTDPTQLKDQATKLREKNAQARNRLDSLWLQKKREGGIVPGTTIDQKQQQHGEESSATGHNNNQITDINDLPSLVSELNKVLLPSGQGNWSCVDFDALKGKFFVKVFNDVLCTITPHIAKDISNEQPNSVAKRLCQLLVGVLNYRCEDQQALYTALVVGDKDYLQPVLAWLLSRMTINQKRIYLAQFLTPIDVPNDFHHTNESVKQCWQQYQQMRQRFVEVHKAYEQVKTGSGIAAGGRSPGELRQLISQWGKEEETLAELVSKKKGRLTVSIGAGKPFEDFYYACSCLWDAEQEQNKLQKQEAELMLA